MVSAEVAVTLGLNAVSAILILSIAALGLAIIFGFMGVINLTHGSFITLGGYTVWVVSTQLGLGFWPGLLLAPFVVAVVGYVVEVLIIRHLYHRLLDTLLATWGLAIAIRESIRLIAGETAKEVSNPIPGSVDIGMATYPSYRLFLMAFSAAIVAGVLVLFYRTNFGVRLRAVIQDGEAAELLGIAQDRMYQFSFAFGAGLAGLAGAAITPITSIQPDMGLSYLVESFFAVIVGGAGTIVGVIYGSIVVAGLTNVMTFSLDPTVAQTIVFVIVIVILAVQPEVKRRLEEWRER